MRRERLSRGVGLRAEAKRIGVSAVELSAMEHGRVRPVPTQLSIETPPKAQWIEDDIPLDGPQLYCEDDK